MRQKLFYFLFFIFMYHEAVTHAAEPISVTKKHIIILQADLENIWGLYYFGIRNETQTEKEFSFPVSLPEGVEYQPGEGFTDKDFRYDGQGKLSITKSFHPGFSLLSIQFKKKVEEAKKQKLTMHFVSPVEEVSLATLKHAGLNLKTEGMSEGLSPMLDPQTYEGFLVKNLEKDQLLEIEIFGIPEGRNRLWLLCSIFGALIASCGLLPAIRRARYRF